LPDAVSGATNAPSAVSASRFSASLRRLTFIFVAFVMAATLVAVDGVGTPVPAAEAKTELSGVMNTLTNQLGKRYKWGATGMRRYDCSGLVYRVFERNGLLKRIGGRRTAKGYYRWFRDRGLVTRSNPRKGDLVVWGNNVSHIGIYIGNGRAISALTTGVSRHGIKGLNVSFKAYLRVRISR
jgi:cell wall-associated NlpC family hydrolase